MTNAPGLAFFDIFKHYFLPISAIFIFISAVIMLIGYLLSHKKKHIKH